MTLPTVLTHVEQLEGKTIAFFNTYSSSDSYFIETLIYTEDNCILISQTNNVIDGDNEYAKTFYFKDIVDIYEAYEEELVEWLIIIQEQADKLAKNLHEKYAKEENERKKEQEELEYETYLRLKRKFEVEYKL